MTGRIGILLVLLGIVGILLTQQPWALTRVVAWPERAVSANAWQDPLAGLTADDMARAVWAMNRAGELSAEQRAALQPLLVAGLAAHTRVAASRAALREARAQTVLR